MTQPHPILYLGLGKYKHIWLGILSIFALIRFPVRLSVQHLHRKSFRRQLQKSFPPTWAALYQWSSISPSLLQALVVSMGVHLSPQDVTSSSSSCLSNTWPAARPVTFCSSFQQDWFSALPCQEMTEARLIEPPRGCVV